MYTLREKSAFVKSSNLLCFWTPRWLRIMNHMYITWILKLNLPVVNFQHKRTIHHWEPEFPIDADALWKICYTYYWKTHVLRDTSLPFIKFLCSSDMKTISLYYSKWRVIFDFFVLLLKNISLLWLHRTFLIEQIRQLWTSLVEITEHVYDPNNFWKIFAFDIIDRW